jgi:hypothetical protein
MAMGVLDELVVLYPVLVEGLENLLLLLDLLEEVAAEREMEHGLL